MGNQVEAQCAIVPFLKGHLTPIGVEAKELASKSRFN
jgi:hypothetical protein